jgi:hypothetical protein
MKKILIILLLLISLYDLTAQKTQVLITGSFNDVPLKSFIEDLERQYDLRFFYKDISIAGIRVTADFPGVSLKTCLETILGKTALNFTILGNYLVVIYGGSSVKDLFRGEYAVPDTTAERNPRPEELSREELRQLQYKILNIGTPGRIKSGTATLSGYLKNFETGEPVAGGNIYISTTQKGATSDANGFYKINLPIGNQIVSFSCLGMQPTNRNINLYSDGRLDVEMEVKMNVLEGAEIVGQGEGKVGRMHIGTEKMEIVTIKSIPTLLGESDVVKSVLILPGVVSVGEGTAGFNVRGGSTDQNLILIDRATIYYPSHFFGNFSAVNSEIIQNATLYKGSIPVKYGGRISSVFEINSIDGNHEKVSGSSGISPIYARFNIGGPLAEGKSTFLTSIRSTYSDWLLRKIKVPELNQSSAGFYDIQGKLDLFLNKKNNLLVNFYRSSDRFQLHSDTSYKYRNTIGSLILNHEYNSSLNSSTSLICSLFNYEISNVNSELQSFILTHSLSNISLINDFDYSTGKGPRYNLGAELNFYSINPGERKVPVNSNLEPVNFSDDHALEYALYVGTERSVTGRIKLDAGIRLSGLVSFDDGKKYIYAPDLPYEEEYITDTVFINKHSIQKIYISPEWRLSVSYSSGRYSSLKFSYNKTAQYIHMISNTMAISPTDTWKLSDIYILPETGNQISTGYFKSFRRKKIEVSCEVFYKWVYDIKQYKEGASLLLNDHIETEIVNGRGKSYGVELSMEKSGGRIYGRIDYTYSRTLIKTVSRFSEELINGGEYFPANYDKPHNLNLLLSLKASRRLILSTGIYYSTGRPITYPVSLYKLGDQVFLQYSKYNQYRLSDYFRTDFSMTVTGSLKKDRAVHSSLTFSLYNVTSRRNAYSVYYKSEGGKLNAYQLSVFGTIIPTITYNLDF